MNILIVEDEKLTALRLESLLHRYDPTIRVLAHIPSVSKTIKWLKDPYNTQPDLIFLDIHLPKLKGMAFLKSLSRQPAVIITTAYHQYAVEGFALNVTDYLLKPYEFERFLLAVNKVKAGQSIYETVIGAGEVRDYLFLSVQKKKVRVLYADILYIESQREYVKVVTTKVEYISKMSTLEIESILPGTLFKRIHRSFIISINKVDSYTAESVEIGGIKIPIGRGYRSVIDSL